MTHASNLSHISSWVTTSYQLLCTFLELIKGKHCRTMSYLASVLPLFPSDSEFKRFKRPFLIDSLSASHQLYGWNLQYYHFLYINQLGQKYDSLIYPPNPLVDYQSSVFLFFKVEHHFPSTQKKSSYFTVVWNIFFLHPQEIHWQKSPLIYVISID